MVIGVFVKEAIDTSLFKAPSNSLIFESTFVAIFARISVSITIFSKSAFFLRIANRVS